MKKKINRNYFWAETFIKELSSIGVKYACISPGSRNTALTLAVANNKKIKSFVHIDERCSAFFALGIAKASGTPVILLCTSGTATAELYPAIIEAYQQRVPLIICTADRPPELLNTGANQTINQNNLYKNHIRWFFDAGLPEPIQRRIRHIKAIAKRAVYESLVRSKGPVHLNFPFRKPFEPDEFTDEVDSEVIKAAELVLPDKKDLYKEN
ncbi:MAG: 2-succinyl-5-enolpyruvyl-6-hydroxy-3-cyclohexene-1-carboxylic-acid synthase, partial [Ignavibacteria bacterium RIFOXYB2_FULL_36_7]